MSVQINNTNETLINTQLNNRATSFKSNPVQNDRVQLSTSKQGLSNTEKAGIIVVIVSAIALGIECIKFKGKHLKSFWEKISGNKKIPEKDVKKPSTEFVKSTKNIDVKFENGKALTADGKAFSGEISIQYQNKEFTYEYKDGVLKNIKTASKDAAADEILVDGVKVKFENGKALNTDGKVFNGKIPVEYGNKKFVYEYKDGVLHNIEVVKK